MYRTNAALCSVNRWDPMTRVVQHSEWSRRKIDCAFHSPPLSYDAFRRNIRAVLTANPPEDDMTPAQEAALNKRLDDLDRKIDGLAVGPGWGHPQGALPLLARIAKKLGA